MPKLPRISGAEAVRTLERLGFSVVRQRGSHINRQMKVGTLAGVLRQAGVSPEEFMEAL